MSTVAIALTVQSWGELSLNRSGVRKEKSGVKSRAEGDMGSSNSEACLDKAVVGPHHGEHCRAGFRELRPGAVPWRGVVLDL